MISYLIIIKEKDVLVVFNDFFIVIMALILGSFFNMLIYRLPLQVSLFNPKRSICPNCKSTIKWYENIPLLSYIYLRGKCSHCNTRISISYFCVECITLFITVLLYKHMGLNLEFVLLVTIFYILIILSFIDLKYKAVPDYLLILFTTMVLLYVAAFKIENLNTFFIFAGGIMIIELYVTYYIQNIKSRILNDPNLKFQKAIGEGDIPIIAAIGGVLGLELGLVAIFLSAIFAIIPSIVNKLTKKEIETPFIPYLSLGFFLALVYEEHFINILKGIM